MRFTTRFARGTDPPASPESKPTEDGRERWRAGIAETEDFSLAGERPAREKVFSDIEEE